MKNKIIIYKIIAVLSVVTIAIAGFVLAKEALTQVRAHEDRDRTNIILEPEMANGKNTGVVDVYLQMDDGIKPEDNEQGDVVIKDAASVQSFQIGLDISAAVNKKEDVQFEFVKDLKENGNTVKLATYTQDLVPDENSSGKYKGEKLKIYYVGTQELNDTESDETVLIGRIKFNSSTLGDNETVKITPMAAPVTTAASVGHTETPIDVHPDEDQIEFVMNEKDSEHVDDPTENETPGENTTPGGDSNTTPDENTTPGDSNTTPDENTTSGGSNTTPEGNTPSGENPTTNGTQSGGKNNGYSQLDEDKAKGNLMNQIVNSLKTGANHSLTWAIIAVTALIILAIVLVKIKKNTPKRKSKH